MSTSTHCGTAPTDRDHPHDQQDDQQDDPRRDLGDAPLALAMRTIAHLERALGSSREIGASVGILMERHGLTYEDAWQRLRRASQDRNVPVRELAAELVLTGLLDGSTGAGNSTGADPQR